MLVPFYLISLGIYYDLLQIEQNRYLCNCLINCVPLLHSCEKKQLHGTAWAGYLQCLVQIQDRQTDIKLFLRGNTVCIIWMSKLRVDKEGEAWKFVGWEWEKHIPPPTSSTLMCSAVSVTLSDPTMDARELCICEWIFNSCLVPLIFDFCPRLISGCHRDSCLTLYYSFARHSEVSVQLFSSTGLPPLFLLLCMLTHGCFTRRVSKYL